MNRKYKHLETLYRDNLVCAEEFGIEYSEEAIDWYTREGKKEKFSYESANGKKILEKKTLKYIEDLVIPPMWSDVEISPNPKTHILAYGYDDKGRKQYIYNEKWSEARSLVNSYKLILFGTALGNVRTEYKKFLKSEFGSKEYLLGLFIFLLDETVIRVGNDYYFQENGTIGLATLQTEHITKKGNKIFLKFIGKSGKEHEIEIENKNLKTQLIKILDTKKGDIFEYQDSGEARKITPSQVNEYIREISKTELISAKDFRTWHATRIVFEEMIENLDSEISETQRKKVLLSGFDSAAEKLGNTRTMIRNSYAHGDLIESVEEQTFLKRYNSVKIHKKLRNLSVRESELLRCLEKLYDENMSD
ncbi:DNA topoisomerase IB [Candidatus Gracilibacteria bacterium]|nr:DNA topoisomerase IB [Candidatus Gracilibacteria bacterium]